jgi:hypothetical protein
MLHQAVMVLSRPERPITTERIHVTVAASRELIGMSVENLKRSLHRLCHSIGIAEAHLGVATALSRWNKNL